MHCLVNVHPGWVELHACWRRCPAPDSSCVSVQTLQPQLDALHDDLTQLSADVRGETDKRAAAEQELSALRAALEKVSCSIVRLSPCPASPDAAQLNPLHCHSGFWQILSEPHHIYNCHHPCLHTQVAPVQYLPPAHEGLRSHRGAHVGRVQLPYADESGAAGAGWAGVS